MRFESRSASANRGVSRRRGDKHSIVGLSGWLFADLLLAVAVIFLVADAPPSFGQTDPEVSTGDLEVEIQNDGRLSRVEDGMPIWDGSDPGTEDGVTLRVVFSQPVKNFGVDANDLANDIVIGGDSEGWLTERIIDVSGTEEEDEAPDGTVWHVILTPRSNYSAGTVEVAVAENAVFDNGNNTNQLSEAVKFQARLAPETTIDVQNAVQLVVKRPSGRCNGDRTSQATVIEDSLRRVAKFDVINVASNVRRSLSENFVQWIQDKYGRPRIGFAFVYASTAEGGRQTAEAWAPCVIEAFRNLGYTSSLNIPSKAFEDKQLGRGELKIEMYFFTGSADASVD